MPVITHPDKIATCYRPLYFNFNEISSTEIVKRFRIRIINAYYAVEYAKFYVEALQGGFNSFYGACDVQEILKLLLPPKIEYFILHGAQGLFMLSYRIIVEPMKLNAIGLIEDFGTSYDSNICFALCASTLPEGTASLFNYYENGSTYKALKSKYNYEVSNWQDEYFTFIVKNEQLAAEWQRVIYVKFFDGNNNIVGEFFYNISLFVNQEYLDYSANVGIQFILNNYQLYSGTISDNYSVQYGVRNTLDMLTFDFQSYTQKYYYTVSDCVHNETVILLFQNRLGAYDSAVFNKKKKVNLSVKSSFGENPLQWDISGEAETHSPMIRGEYRYNAESNTTYELESNELTKENVNWIRELLESTSVYLQYRAFDEYGSPLVTLPCVILDGNFELYDSEELSEKLKIKMKLSNERILK